MTTVAELPAGFADKVLSAQSTFRSVMDAMARPGSVQRIAAVAGAPAADDARHRRDRADAVRSRYAGLARCAGCRRRPMSPNGSSSTPARLSSRIPSICSFALIGDRASAAGARSLRVRQHEYPDRSTTLILQVESLTQGPAFELRGPGIDGTAVLRATIQPTDLFERLAINATLFPRGIDVVLVA